MMFTDIDQVIEADAKAENERRSIAPYNSNSFAVFTGMKQTSIIRDYWAIGCLILNMIVGPELFKTAEDYSSTKYLFDCSE